MSTEKWDGEYNREEVCRNSQDARRCEAPKQILPAFGLDEFALLLLSFFRLVIIVLDNDGPRSLALVIRILRGQRLVSVSSLYETFWSRQWLLVQNGDELRRCCSRWKGKLLLDNLRRGNKVECRLKWLKSWTLYIRLVCAAAQQETLCHPLVQLRHSESSCSPKERNSKRPLYALNPGQLEWLLAVDLWHEHPKRRHDANEACSQWQCTSCGRRGLNHNVLLRCERCKGPADKETYESRLK